MSRTTQTNALQVRSAQGGFSLIELMVAVAIAVFLIGGLVSVLEKIRSTSAMQTQLAQMQDGQRLAMTMMAGVVESAGYFPNPYTYTAAATMPTGTASLFTTAGTPVIAGVSAYNAQGDSLTVRYAAAQNDNVFNCQGGTNTTVAPTDGWENTFYVNGSYQLVCALWKASTQPAVTTLPLVSGVKSMGVLYGVQMNNTGNGTCTDTYMTAAQVSAANAGAGAWANVCSAVVTLTFFDTTYPGPYGAASPTLPPFTRVMALLQTAGVL